MQTNKSNPIKIISLLALTLFFQGIAFSQDALGKGAKLADKIVAQIGDEIILLSDIQARKLQMIQNGEAINNNTECMLLEELLFEKLLVNQAKIDSIEVSDDMVNQEMEARLRVIAEQMGGMEKLEDFYGKSVAQIKAEFFEQIKKRILAEQMREEITKNVRITPIEVKEFYNGLHKDSIPYINSKVVVSQVVLYPKVTAADKEKAKTQLNEWRDEIIGGAKRFETIATLYSDDPGSRLQGGDLGWQTRGTMVAEFEAALFSLEIGEISPVFETQYGYHIVQLMDRKGDNYKSRHILNVADVSDKALMKSVATIDSLHKEIKKGTITFEEAARKFSDDEESKQNGGQIVNPYTGDYNWDIQNLNDIDPQMSRVVNTLKVGEFTSPALYNNMFAQKQGIRIVKLVSQTKPHKANLKDDYTLISTAAANQKKQTVIDKWVNSKIGSTYFRISENYLHDCKFKYNWVKVGS